MQYLPLFIIGHGSENDHARLFCEKLLSFLIHKVFNPYKQQEHLSVRQSAWNYLSSLLSRENNIIRTNTVVKCIQIAIKKFEEAQTEKTERKQSLSSSHSQTSASENDKKKVVVS